MFLSIIADYDLPTSICELVDNAIDHWIANAKPANTWIKLFLNVDRQIITVRDNAGGVPSNEVRLLIAPGASREISAEEFIGNFGVGGKRAGVALGERVVVTTRNSDEPAVEFAITNEWLNSDSWDLRTTRVDGCEIGTTEVKITELRQGFDDSSINRLRVHLERTYAKFVRAGCSIQVNGVEIGAASFDNWAYPPNYPPRQSRFAISPDDNAELSVVITGGLILDRDPKVENYGVYFYCNDRLIVSHLRTREVGFITGEAGTPHRDASTFRVIVELNGPPELMPWASNKSALNYSHPSFLELREKIIFLTTYFSKLSRSLKNDREVGIFQYQHGDIAEIDLAQPGTPKRVVIPPVPRARKKAYPYRIIDENTEIFHSAPWTRGLVESMGVVDIVSRKNFDTKNRIALILLDSNLEIGLKEFIVHQVDLFPPNKYSDAVISDLFRKRHEVINKIKPHVGISEHDWIKIRHYYERRNKLVHERATVQITDREVSDYRDIVERVLSQLFDLRF